MGVAANENLAVDSHDSYKHQTLDFESFIAIKSDVEAILGGGDALKAHARFVFASWSKLLEQTTPSVLRMPHLEF